MDLSEGTLVHRWVPKGFWGRGSSYRALGKVSETLEAHGSFPRLTPKPVAW